MNTILLVILILLLIGALPTWPYSTGWGLLSKRRTRLGVAYSRDFAVNRTAFHNIGWRVGTQVGGG